MHVYEYVVETFFNLYYRYCVVEIETLNILDFRIPEFQEKVPIIPHARRKILPRIPFKQGGDSIW